MLTKLTTTILALTTLTTAAYIPASGKSSFQLLALTSDSYAGTWLGTWHTGAGTSVAVLTSNQTLAPAFKFAPKRGDLYYQEGSPSTPFSLALSNNTDFTVDAPTGYYAVTVNISEPNAGFNFNPNDRNTLNLPMTVPSGSTFAACTVTGDPFFEETEQLFWRAGSTKAADEPLCRDVQLEAIFNHNYR